MMRCRDETLTENRVVSPDNTADYRLVGISRYTASCGGRRQFLRLRRFCCPSDVHAAELPGVVWFQPDLYAVPENTHLCGDRLGPDAGDWLYRRLFSGVPCAHAPVADGSLSAVYRAILDLQCDPHDFLDPVSGAQRYF